MTDNNTKKTKSKELKDVLERIENSLTEARLQLDEALGIVLFEKGDLTRFQERIKWKLQKFFQNHLQLHIKNMI